MPYRAVLKHTRISPRKARLVADLIRGMDVEEALSVLAYTRKKAAPVVGKVVRSAAANARRSPAALETDDLFIQEIRVDKGVTLKRWRPRAMGRAFPIHRPTSHITVVLEEKR
jgi:large subunit ribosomal protein L22